MSLLHEIQEAIVDPQADLGPILLKLRLLADRLGSDQLEAWVNLESEGYPANADIPEYRQVEVSYSGNFQNSAWQATDHPIPPHLIEHFAGKQWIKVDMRESIAAIDELLSKKGGRIIIDSANLVLLLQDKVFPEMNCTSVTGVISGTSVREIQNTVRNRILELTMKLEKEVPSAAAVTIGKPMKAESGADAKIAEVVHMTVHGSNTMIANTGSHTKISVKNTVGDVDGMVSELINAGIPQAAAEEFSHLVVNEKPDGPEKPFGKKVTEWLSKKLPIIAEGTWGAGISVVTGVLEEAAKRYYGLD